MLHCSYDWLSIRDGTSEDAVMIKDGICGRRIPKTITSTGNELLIKFRSDSTEAKKGFQIEVEVGNALEITIMSNHETLNFHNVLNIPYTIIS